MSLQDGRIVLVFLGAVTLMSLRPVLLHDAQKATGGIDSQVFLLGSEALKICVCIIALCWHRVTVNRDKAQLWLGVHHTISYAPPAATYLFMNAFFVYGNKFISPARWQLLGNMKIMTTAVLRWMVLSSTLAANQWCALVLLTLSTALGQVAGAGDDGTDSDILKGSLLNLLCCTLSGLGAVLTERLLKSSSSKDLSIFATNVHMAGHTVLLNATALAFSAGSLPDFGLFFKLPVFLAVVSEALSGILLSQIMRFADSNAKNYAYSISVFTTIGFGQILFGYRPQLGFYIGAILVVVSMLLYYRDASAAKKEK